MKKRIITNQSKNLFKNYLIENEKATATIEKYMRDIHLFVEYATDKPLDKPLVLEYKTSLEQTYAIRSANSMLAALNSFFRFLGWHDLCVKQFKVQKEAYCSEEKELTKAEYTALVRTAEQKKTNGFPSSFKRFAGQALGLVNCKVLRWRLCAKEKPLYPAREKQERYLLSVPCEKNCFDMLQNRK